MIVPAPILEIGFMTGLFKGGAEKSRHLAGSCAAVMTRLGVPVLDAGALITSDPLDGIHLGKDQHAILGRAVAERVVGLLDPA